MTTNPDAAPSTRSAAPGVVEIDGVQYAFGGVETLLGQAQSADEMLMALYHGGLGSGAVLDSLIRLLLDHPTRMPIIQTPSC